MYTLNNTTVRSYHRETGVQYINAGLMKIRTLLTENSEVYLTLTNPFLTGLHTLRLSDVADQIYNTDPNLTVDAWLTLNGTTTLPTRPGKPVLQDVACKMVDAFVAGYVATTSTGFTGSDTGDILDIDRPDIALNKDGINYGDMRNNVLASVGGYLHMTDSDPTAYYIKDAATSMRIALSQKINLISLDTLGGISLIPMTQCSVSPKVGTELYKGFTLTTDSDFTNKTVWLSIGGYLLNLNKEYRQINAQSISIDWPKLHIHLKFFTAKQYIDLSTVVAAMLTLESNVIDKTSLNSNEAIMAWLALSQSFIIVIDNPSVNVRWERLEDTGLPGKYYVYQDPYVPMLSHDGRLPPISLIDERKAWVVSTSIKSGMVNNLYGERMNPNDTSLYTRRNYSDRPHRRASLYALRITSTNIVL